MDTKPWDLVPAFSLDRLMELGRRLLSIRSEAVKLQEPEKGDSAWVLGCRVYDRTRHQISKDALSGRYPWLLATASTNLQFDVRIGGHPIHIFRGDSDDPDSRQLIRGLAKQMSLFEEDQEEHEGDRRWANYLVVETDPEGNGHRVVFFQANESGERRNPWVVPIEAPVPATPGVLSIAKEGPDLPAPAVKARVTSRKTANDGDDSRGA